MKSILKEFDNEFKMLEIAEYIKLDDMGYIGIGLQIWAFNNDIHIKPLIKLHKFEKYMEGIFRLTF